MASRFTEEIKKLEQRRFRVIYEAEQKRREKQARRIENFKKSQGK
jgi:hypothetical protein